jgi:cell division protein FtsZ
MGGGTGSGAAPVVAEVAKESGCLTVGIVTKPFVFEGKRRLKQAKDAIERLRHHVDTVIVVNNDRLLEIIPDDTPMEKAFAVADDILRQGVVGISDIIVKPGLINVDFADVRAVMNNAGTALMGIGIGSGKTAAEDAAAAAISSPLLDSTIDNAKGVVFNISGGPKLSLNEVNRAARLIYSTVEPDANVIFGALMDDTLGDSISITVLATGFVTKENDSFNKASIKRDTKLNDVVRTGLKHTDKSVKKGGPDLTRRTENIAPKSSDDKIPDFLKTLKKN